MFHRLTAQSLWADEGNSVAQAMRPLPELVRHAALDIHPPLYYVLLHLWVRLFGTGEWALRSLSAVAGVAVVWLIWALAHRLWGRGTARVAAAIAVVHPFLVYYAQEVRMYVFVALWGALAAYALVRIILREGLARLSLGDVPQAGKVSLVARAQRVSPRHPALLLGGWDVVYVLAVAAGLWTHYAFPVLPAVLALTYVVWMYTTRRSLPLLPRVVRLLTVHLAALVLYVPWLPTALERVRAWPRPAHPLTPEEALTATWQWLALGPAPSDAQARWLWLWIALFVVALWPWRRWTAQGYRRPHWLSWGMPLAWLAVPVGAMLAMGLFKPAYLKFLIIVLPPFVVLVARGVLAPMEALARARPRWPRLLALVWLVGAFSGVLLVESASLARYFYAPEVARDDYRGIVRYIEAIATPEDAVILNAPGQREVFCYYFSGCDVLAPWSTEDGRVQGTGLAVYALPTERPPSRERLEAQLEAITRAHARVFVLFWATDESDPDRVMEFWLDNHAYKALDVWRGNVRFVIYATPRHGRPPDVEGRLDARLGEAITLERFALWSPEAAPGDVVQVRLLWRTDRPLDRRYKVFLQLLGPGDQLVAQRDAEPVGGSRPTTSWQPGEAVEDNHGLLIPLATPPGQYRLIAGMYDAQTGQRLPVVQGGVERDFVEIPTYVTVARPQVPPPVEVLPMRHRNDEVWNSIVLLGHDRYRRGFRHAPELPVPPGDFLHVTLYWLAREKPLARWRVSLSLVDGWGNVVGSVTDDLAGQEYPTTRWAAGEVVRGEFDLFVPPDVKPGTYGLRVQLLRDDTPVRDPVPLGTVEVRPEAP